MIGLTHCTFTALVSSLFGLIVCCAQQELGSSMVGLFSDAQESVFALGWEQQHCPAARPDALQPHSESTSPASGRAIPNDGTGIPNVTTI
jgi:hypothetical protein